jgi:hypothetical protein
MTNVGPNSFASVAGVGSSTGTLGSATTGITVGNNTTTGSSFDNKPASSHCFFVIKAL